jgi:hypothetical protein
MELIGSMCLKLCVSTSEGDDLDLFVVLHKLDSSGKENSFPGSTAMDGNFQPVLSTYRKLPDWLAGLCSKDLSEADLAKVVGGNAIRVLRQVLKT